VRRTDKNPKLPYSKVCDLKCVSIKIQDAANTKSLTPLMQMKPIKSTSKKIHDFLANKEKSSKGTSL
jgi:hypothetical protein